MSNTEVTHAARTFRNELTWAEYMIGFAAPVNDTPGRIALYLPAGEQDFPEVILWSHDLTELRAAWKATEAKLVARGLVKTEDSITRYNPTTKARWTEVDKVESHPCESGSCDAPARYTIEIDGKVYRLCGDHYDEADNYKAENEAEAAFDEDGGFEDAERTAREEHDSGAGW